MPRALYPKQHQLSATITRDTVKAGKSRQLKNYVFCAFCEDRFNKGGEEYVIELLAPTSNSFPLHERLKFGFPREHHQDFSRFAAYDVGVDAQKLAFFALSIAWKGAAFNWTLPDRTKTTLLDLGAYREAIRQFLLGKSAFPRDVASVIVMVGNDSESRSVWNIPSQEHEGDYEHYRFIARGVFFRIILGNTIPAMLRDASCLSPREVIIYASIAHRVTKDFAPLLDAPVSE